MRRAIPLLIMIALTAVLGAGRAHSEAQVVSRVNGIGLIDYSHKPTFKVGDWVRYHMTGSSQMGMHDDYDLTVLIAGEEDFWGDRGFWVESWTSAQGKPQETTATLMSYSIFDDSLPIQHMQVYQRKMIGGSLTESGQLQEDIVKPAASILKSRTLFQKPLMWDVDTLSADTVQTPMGTFHARRISIKDGTGATATMADSSIYNEVRENRMSYYALEVPITHVAREDVENIISRRSWMLGRSSEGSALIVRERGNGTARLIAFGHGLTPRFVPADRRIKPQVAASTSAPARPAPRKTVPGVKH